MTGSRRFPDIGTAITGRVHRFTEMGTLVALGSGLVGMIRNYDLSWLNPKAHGSETLKVGDAIDVVVLRVSEPSESGYVYVDLGHKQTVADPWVDAANVHPVGSRAVGTVVSAEPFGAIVEFATGFRALIPHRELSWTRHKPKVADHVAVGDVVETEILSVDVEKRRIKTSLRRTQPNPWTGLSEHVTVGAEVEGTVVSLIAYGVFVSLSNGCTGLLHRSLMASPPESFTVGLRCRVRIESLDEGKERIAFSEVALASPSEGEPMVDESSQQLAGSPGISF